MKNIDPEQSKKDYSEDKLDNKFGAPAVGLRTRPPGLSGVGGILSWTFFNIHLCCAWAEITGSGLQSLWKEVTNTCQKNRYVRIDLRVRCLRYFPSDEGSLHHYVRPASSDF